MQRKNAIIIFTRIPAAGKTKTRLMPYLTPEECKKLHLCFLRDIAKQCRKAAADIYVCYTPEGEPGELKDIFGRQAGYFSQKGENLGARMEQGIRQVLEWGYQSCVLIGTDIPEIRGSDLRQAFTILEDKDVVFGPTADGGYYLVGMKKLHSEVFAGQSYGHGSVLTNTMRAFAETGIRTGSIRMLHDLDTREDLCGYRERMREFPALQETETGKYLMRKLRISIIVPIYNEEKTIEQLLAQLRPLQKSCEILLVDGGSTDRTLEYITPEFKLLHSPKGRANQMNLGAKESSGDVLFFLHCDSELPKSPLAEIRYVMKDHRAGCFGVAFHSRHFFMWTCRVISNHRIKDRKVMFGDQGIFITRELFFQAGMFPELPIMEDYQFSLTLKEMGVKLGMARHRIYTSDRRFPKKTIPMLRLMWKMNRLRKMYRDGVAVERIAEMYRDVR
ncbi:MAG: TIGR04283 family arsenosugar biosynthesis glycosyltransferase [Eubacteriales bacterium]|nr:TIGR04283 family arsenosugar biosynthesis glycosyltransferase [Eubacteriales bacterium]